MENAGIEALMIGVNVLVFVAALSVAIMLMINVLDMSNIANDMIKQNNNGSLVVADISNVYTKTVSGEQLLKYNEKLSQSINEIINNYTLKVIVSGTEEELTTYIQSKEYHELLNKSYKYTVNEDIMNPGKKKIVFEEI